MLARWSARLPRRQLYYAPSAAPLRSSLYATIPLPGGEGVHREGVSEHVSRLSVYPLLVCSSTDQDQDERATQQRAEDDAFDGHQNFLICREWSMDATASRIMLND